MQSLLRHRDHKLPSTRPQPTNGPSTTPIVPKLASKKIVQASKTKVRAGPSQSKTSALKSTSTGWKTPCLKRRHLAGPSSSAKTVLWRAPSANVRKVRTTPSLIGMIMASNAFRKISKKKSRPFSSHRVFVELVMTLTSINKRLKLPVSRGLVRSRRRPPSIPRKNWLQNPGK